MLNNTDIVVSKLFTSLLNNSTNKSCSERFSILRCYWPIYGYILAYFLFALSLVPQIIHLHIYRTRYIAGISYIWIIIRTVALASLMAAETRGWASLWRLFAFISTIIIFSQIIIYSNNRPRKNIFALLIITLFIWSMGGIFIFFFRKQKYLLITISYLLLAIQMLPQILLNSLLRTAKALSKISILLLAITDILLFSSFFTNKTPFINLISIYYSMSFFLFIYLQSLVYSDAHIHLISRSAHTVMTPGVDIFTGLDIDGIRSTGQDPQMFSIDEVESMDGSDVIYQAVTTNKSPRQTNKQTPLKRFLWYATLGCIFCVEAIITALLIYRVGSLWIIFVPVSIPFIIGIFFLIRTRLDALKTEILRKML